ncbi:MAG TPA: NAD(P)/FAD-dependent oxidoreductase [Myxococcales bacterium]|nr:NAD(P)/FAD-dependent oxidoreductase [Myxococcales bacterium]
MPEPRVVIVGGGFGGLSAVRSLRDGPVQVTLVDRRNHHLFQPLLYQVATAALNPSDIAVPIRRILRRQENVEVVLGEAGAVDVPGRRVLLRDGAVRYDFLVIATGATHAYFGHPEWEKDAPGLKTVEDALDIRRRVLLAYEAAEREDDPARRAEWLTFVVVGGGPTGVEVSGALAEIARHVLTRDFRRIDPRTARVVLVEAGPRILPAYAPELSERAAARLRRMGCEVLVGTAVTAVDAGGVSAGGQRIGSRCTIWAAGVAPSPIARTLGAPLDRVGRVEVASDLSLPGAPEVFVIGDLAAVKDGQGRLIPGLAQPAIQGGRHAARQILRTIRGEPREPFHYRDKGSLATIGRNAAVAQIGRLKTEGFLAWVLWLLVHIVMLIGFRNRVLVLAEWAWTYLRYERGARLITGPVPELLASGGRAGPGPPDAADRPGSR